jgi:glycosyltransferase involved in cell wall biosynthesis
MADVTVVIPTRDRWQLLERTALRSALGQTGVDVEVVIVDDGSREPAPRAIDDAQDPRVHVLRHATSRGVAAGRNAGIEAASAPWVAFLDDDDLWAPHKLRAQLDAAADGGAAFAYAGAVWVDEALQLRRGHAPPEPDGLAEELLRWNVLWGGASNVLARTDVVRGLGGFDPALHQLADWDLWIRLALDGPAAVARDVLVAMVVHEESMLLVDDRDVFLELDHVAAKHREERMRRGVELDRARFARWVADGHLRAGRRGAAARAYVHGTKAPGNLGRAAAAALLGRRPLVAASALRAAIPGAVETGHRTASRPDWLERYR